MALGTRWPRCRLHPQTLLRPSTEVASAQRPGQWWVFRYSLRLLQLAGTSSTACCAGPFSRAGLALLNVAGSCLASSSPGLVLALTLSVAMIISWEKSVDTRAATTIGAVRLALCALAQVSARRHSFGRGGSKRAAERRASGAVLQTAVPQQRSVAAEVN